MYLFKWHWCCWVNGCDQADDGTSLTDVRRRHHCAVARQQYHHRIIVVARRLHHHVADSRDLRDPWTRGHEVGDWLLGGRRGCPAVCRGGPVQASSSRCPYSAVTSTSPCRLVQLLTTPQLTPFNQSSLNESDVGWSQLAGQRRIYACSACSAEQGPPQKGAPTSGHGRTITMLLRNIQ